MAAQIHTTESETKVALTRNKLVLEQARAVGLLGSAKNTRLSGRVSVSRRRPRPGAGKN